MHRNRKEIVQALSRGQASCSDLFKWGLFTTVGDLALKHGLSPFASSAFASAPTETPLSSLFGALPFTQTMLRADLPTRTLNLVAALSPVPMTQANETLQNLNPALVAAYPDGDMGPIEGRPAATSIQIRLHPNMSIQDSSTMRTFNGTVPPKLLLSRYGEPALFRHHNKMPFAPKLNNGVSRHATSTHEHSGHHGAENDGFSGQLYNYHWPLVLTGFTTINTAVTDIRAGTPNVSGGIRKTSNPLLAAPVAYERVFEFVRGAKQSLPETAKPSTASKGQLRIKTDGGALLAETFNRITSQPKFNTREVWTLKTGGGRLHPIHIRFEEGQIIARDGSAASVPKWGRSRNDVHRLRPGSEKNVQIATRKLGLGTLQATAPRDNRSTTLMVGHEPSGQWMKNSVTDTSRFVSGSAQTFLGWRDLLQSRNYAQAGPLQLTTDQFLFQNGCMACHSIGGGDKIGPDLLGITETRTTEVCNRPALTAAAQPELVGESDLSEGLLSARPSAKFESLDKQLNNIPRKQNDDRQTIQGF